MAYDFENEAPETRRWRLALNSLTPGGSEFVDDPERCVQFVKWAQDTEHKAMLMYAKRAHDAEALMRMRPQG